MSVYTPKNIDELKTLVASLSRRGDRIRAVGSEQSFSAVNQTEGSLIRTHELTDRLPVAHLAPGWDASTLVRVACGRTVRALQQELAGEGRMLENTPAFTGQTLAGAVSTASHGTGRGFGPICDLVMSVDLLVDGGEILRLEPENGPTNPLRYPGHLVQNNDWFRSVLVGLGAFGIHVSYLMKTVPLVHLLERRYLAPLNEALDALMSAPARHVGILFSPYADRNGVRWACVTDRYEHDPAVGVQRWVPRQRPWPLLFSRLPVDRPILAACSSMPKVGVPWMVRKALGATCRAEFVSSAPRVLDNYPLNQCAGAHAFEASVGMPDMERAMGRFLARAEIEARAGRWLTGPVSLRTVAASQQFLAPTQGRDSVVFEGISLKNSPWGREVLRPFAGDLDRMGARPHFGLDIFTVKSGDDLARLFPKYGSWRQALVEMDPKGRFDNGLMDRLEIRRRAVVAA